MHPTRGILTAALLTLAACGGPPPTVSGLGPGEPCTADAQCQGGLECHAALCDFTRCDSSPDPTAYCALRLDVPASLARCDGDECLVERVDPGGACDLDLECTFGNVCFGATCTPTCRVDASCPDPATRCLPRTDSPGDSSVCRMISTCDQAASPIAFCASRLDVDPALAACDGATCRALTPPGLAGEPCSPDFGCVEGLACLDDLCSAPGGEGTRCRDDSACDQNTLCVDEVCVRGCAGGCPDTQECFPRPGDRLGYCADVDPDDCRTFPDPTARCRQTTSPEATCAPDTGACEEVARFTFLRLGFPDERPEWCLDRDVAAFAAPGPLVMGVELTGNSDDVAPFVLTSTDTGGYASALDSFDLWPLDAQDQPLAYDANGCPIVSDLIMDLPFRVRSIGCGKGARLDLEFLSLDRFGSVDFTRIASSVFIRLYDANACPDTSVAPLTPTASVCRVYERGAELEVVCSEPLRTSPAVGGVVATF
jgi:hypothetical protein